ncbi:hypothetical protein NTGBS_880027 [Candidatus Nitrotoga sp. BS]|nr:hypothetical protein NTGBS_880027 [Candidatus Nitrotoga sp. BS]
MLGLADCIRLLGIHIYITLADSKLNSHINTIT